MTFRGKHDRPWIWSLVLGMTPWVVLPFVPDPPQSVLIGAIIWTSILQFLAWQVRLSRSSQNTGHSSGWWGRHP